MTNAINNYADIIDSRDVIARIEELQDDDNRSEEEEQELAALLKLAKEGAEANSDWEYGETLIRDTYFSAYAQELAEDCGDIPRDRLNWPLSCIDWQWAARELKYDYAQINFDGITYWLRSA